MLNAVRHPPFCDGVATLTKLPSARIVRVSDGRKRGWALFALWLEPAPQSDFRR